MSRYCEPEEIARFGVNAEAIETLSIAGQLTPQIEAASAKVDSYLRGQYTLPLTAWGLDLREATAIVAAWNILSVRGIRPGDNPEDSALYLRYKEIIRWLEGIADDDVHPEVTDSSVGAVSGVTSAAMPVLSSNTQRGWFADSDTAGALPFQGRRQS